MSFLYPRTVSLSRGNAASVAGIQPYGGVRKKDYTTIIAGIPAHIEADRQGAAPESGLPSDAAGQSIWKVMVRLPLGSIRTSDVITSEIGDEYEVISADWGPLLTTCRCQILQALVFMADEIKHDPPKPTAHERELARAKEIIARWKVE